MIKVPEVRINFSRLFYEETSRAVSEHNGWELPSVDECEAKAEEYRNAWERREQDTLSGIQSVTGLNFYSPVLDVSVVPGVIPKSDPLTLNFLQDPEETVDTLTHELIHVLLTDNNAVSIRGKQRGFRLADEWQKLFGFKNDFIALVHVPVHAVHKKLFVDILNDPEGVERDIELLTKYGSTSYLDAWEYVNRVGHEEILGKLRQLYVDLAAKFGNIAVGPKTNAMEQRT